VVERRHTSDAIGRDVGAAAGRVDSRVAAAVADNVQFPDCIASTGTSSWPDSILGLDIALPRTIAPHSDARGHIVNMLLNTSWNVVCLAGDVLMSARTMLPEVEVGDEEIFSLVYRRVELDPLIAG
jgi:hypothetical protein